MNSENFVKLDPTKLIMRCAIPSMVTMAFVGLYSMADGFFVGRFIGKDALAAINLIMPVLMTVFALSNMIATGSSVHISILLGQKKQAEASQVFSFSICFIVLLSCLLGIIGYLFATEIMALVAPGASELSLQYGVEYLRMYARFSPLLLVFFAVDNYLRVCSKEKLSMYLNIFTQVGNIILDILLIAYLGLGVSAAAFATCISLAVGSIISLWIFTEQRMDLYYIKPDVSLKEFMHILANGFSEFFSNISMSIMSMVLNFFILQYGGTIGVAALSIVLYVDGIVGNLIFGLCDAMQPAISYCYGAGRGDRVKAIFKYVLLGAVMLSLLSMLFLLYMGVNVAQLFIRPGDDELLLVLTECIRLFALSYLVGWVDMCFSSLFTALEKPMKSLLISLFGTLIFPIAFLYILSNYWGLTGIWLMPLVAGTASAILTLVLALAK